MQQKATNNMNHQHYMKEEKDARIQELEDYHMENEKGACMSNKAVAMDM
jgi:hypothetical protein